MVPEQPHWMGSLSASIVQRKKLRLLEVDWKAQITLTAGGGIETQILSESRVRTLTQVRSALLFSLHSWFPDGGCHCLDHLTTISVAYAFIICTPQKASSMRAGLG